MDTQIDSSILLHLADKVHLKVQPCVHDDKLSCQILSADDVVNNLKITLRDDVEQIDEDQDSEDADHSDDLPTTTVSERVLKKSASTKLQDDLRTTSASVETPLENDEFEPVKTDSDTLDDELFEGPDDIEESVVDTQEKMDDDLMDDFDNLEDDEGDNSDDSEDDEFADEDNEKLRFS